MSIFFNLIWNMISKPLILLISLIHKVGNLKELQQTT